MSRLGQVLGLVTLLLCSTFSSARAATVLNWEGWFTQAEKRKLTAWLELGVASVESTVAPLPFDVHVYFHRSLGTEPVPWANTIRADRQGVRVHVNPWFSSRSMREDWTIYHELSHLFLPYLGTSNTWFAEGFASYMQYQVMSHAGVLSEQEVDRRYAERLDNARRYYDHDDMPFVAAAPLLAASGNYSTLYWGGAVYFFRVDGRLRASGSSLAEVVSDYVACCRVDRLWRIDDLTAELDRIAGTSLFTDELVQYRTRRGFPGDW